MSSIDWLVLAVTLISIVGYGIYKSRDAQNMGNYLLGGRSLPWYHIGFSVVATQASAITFLSAPGLAYSSGMSFAQFYFGVPLAMIVLSITFVPIFHRMQVFTAYEFLEKRFDTRTRVFTAALFLIQRGVSTGITVYAPSIVLSTILNIDATYTTVFTGLLVIVYTVYGGTKAVSYTQLLQMSVIFISFFVAGAMVVYLLPKDIGFVKALHIAGKSGRANAIDFSLDWDNQYTLWSGLIGGFFLQLSYFGTDQSQVGRYLTGSSIRESRLGLMMNAVIKVPMQFLILLIGILVFAYYQYHEPPIFFNKFQLSQLESSEVHRDKLEGLKAEFSDVFSEKKVQIDRLSTALDQNDEETINQVREELQVANDRTAEIHGELKSLMEEQDQKAETNDNNYIFLSFVTSHFPTGLIGLLIACIFLASMGSTASGLNSLASTSVIDIYKRFINKNASDSGYLLATRLVTVFWGIFAMGIALYANQLGNLLEAVNILGSLFYGTILGIFLVAFYLKKVGAKATFAAAILAEVAVFLCWHYELMAFLWLNLVGCVLVLAIAWFLEGLLNRGFNQKG